MPWSGSVESQREAFLEEFGAAGANRAEVCRRWGISRQTGYVWWKRHTEGSRATLADASRRPRHSPGRSEPDVEAAVLRVRDAEPTWGGRKIRRVLQDQGRGVVPAASTITEILRRSGRLPAGDSAQRRRGWQRFARERPNELWQMDFKGHFALGDGTRCHPLTLLDDSTRFCLELGACANERGETVQGRLERVFGQYGLPEQMLMDHGAPWGNDPQHVYTPLVLWLIRLEIRVLHGRPRHPQTQGKEERFHRTLKEDLIARRRFEDLAEAQAAFDLYRPKYNQVRPHDALDLAVPASRYEASTRALPKRIGAPEYEAEDEVRKVQHGGWMSYRGREWRLPKAFRGQAVAVRRRAEESERAVYYHRQRIALLDLSGGQVRLER